MEEQEMKQNSALASDESTAVCMRWSAPFQAESDRSGHLYSIVERSGDPVGGRVGDLGARRWATQSALALKLYDFRFST